MPSNLLQADVGFPQFKEEQKPDEKITQVVNYLYMLLEQLRYSFGNLGSENFSESGIEELQTILTEPIYGRLENDEGLINELSINATGLYNRLYDQTTGDIVQLAATAQGLYADMHGEGGVVATIAATANGLYTEVWGAEPGTNSRITQNANAISTKVSSGDVSTMISQFANGLALSVTNGTNSSDISITSGGVVLNTQTIQITGMVRFSSFNVPAYSSDTLYSVGDQVTRSGYIYTCIQAGSGHTPSATSTYWTRTASDTFINGGHIQSGTITADVVGAGTLVSTSANNIINLKGYLGVVNADGTSIGYLGTFESANATIFGMYYNGLNGGAVTVRQDTAGIGVGYCGVTAMRTSSEQYVSMSMYKNSTPSTVVFKSAGITPGDNGAMDLGSINYGWGAAYFKCGSYQGAVLGGTDTNGDYIWIGSPSLWSTGIGIDLKDNQIFIVVNGITKVSYA